MNRLEIYYTSKTENSNSTLKIYNDIKGLTKEQVGETFYGNDADVMFEYFKNSIVKDNDKAMIYGIHENTEE